MPSDSSSSSDEEDLPVFKPFIAPRVKVVGVGSERKLSLVVRVVTFHSLATPKFGLEDEVITINKKREHTQLIVSENKSIWKELCSAVLSQPWTATAKQRSRRTVTT